MTLCTLRRLVALGAATATSAFAGTLGFHIGSWHDRGGLNNVNPGIYYKTDGNFVVGTYRNSFKVQSSYLGYVIDEGPFALIVGGVTGYDNALISPLVVPSVSYRGVRVSVAPKFQGVNEITCVHLSYEFKF